MFAAARDHLCRVSVCITISAKMPAGVVDADVAREITGAFRPGALSFWRIQVHADCFFIIADPHASSAVGPEWSQLISFCTGFHFHAVGRCDLNQFLSQ